MKNNQEEKGDILRIIQSLGLERFTEALMWIMQYAFGLETQYLLEPNAKDGSFLLQEVLKSGNFGSSDANQQGVKKKPWGRMYMVFFRNLRYYRFDHWDWFWGPLWRIYHKIV